MEQPDQITEVEFPLRGLHVGHQFGEQPAQTCAVGVNVRVFEPASFRARGGARPGLSRFIDQQLPVS